MFPVIKQARKVNKSLSQAEVREPKPVHTIIFRHLVEDQFHYEFKLS